MIFNAYYKSTHTHVSVLFIYSWIMSSYLVLLKVCVVYDLTIVSKLLSKSTHLFFVAKTYSCS